MINIKGIFNKLNVCMTDRTIINKTVPTIYSFTIEDVSFFVSTYFVLTDTGIISFEREFVVKIIVEDLIYETIPRDLQDCKMQSIPNWVYLTRILDFEENQSYDTALFNLNSINVTVVFLPGIHFHMSGSHNSATLDIIVYKGKTGDELFRLQRKITSHSFNHFIKTANEMNKEFDFDYVYFPFELTNAGEVAKRED